MENPWKEQSEISPQAEHGFRRIANDVFEALLAADLNPSEFKVALGIIHFTWGYDKPHDTIAVSQIANAIKSSERTVRRAKKELVRKRVIYFEPEPKGSYLRFLFNKHYDTWTCLTPVTVVNLIDKYAKKGLSDLSSSKENISKEKTSKCSEDKESQYSSPWGDHVSF